VFLLFPPPPPRGGGGDNSKNIQLIDENITKIIRDDIKAPLFLRNNTTDVSVYRSIIEYKEYDFLVDKHPKIIIDAGANIGLSAVFFANKYPDAKIIAIEPAESNINILEKNIKPYSNIHLIKAALWDSVGEINLFNVGFGNWGFRVGVDNNYNDIRKTQEQCSTPTITVEKILQDYSIDNIDILKLDIEGAEKEVLNKSSMWIGKVNSLIVELHESLKRGCNKAYNKIKKYFDNSCKDGENIYLSKNDYIKILNK
jgi:FkbM family methyltransferase